MHETDRHSETILDEHIYDEVKEAASFEAYEYLSGAPSAREEQKKLFITGENTNPTLDYPDLDLDQILLRENNLLSLKQNLLDKENNELIKRVYRWKLNEKIAEARLLKAAAYGDMRRFQRYSAFVYGKPSKEIFNYSVNILKSAAKDALSTENQSLAVAAQNLLSNLPSVPEVTAYELPSEETMGQAHAQTVNELGDLIDLGTSSGKLDSEQIHTAFSNALEKLDAEGWEVVIDDKTSKSAISVNQEKQRVQIPAERTASSAKVEALIVHELGTHVSRRINGERSRLKLLGIGLDRYERGEEGIATMREQALKNKVEEFSGLESHLAICLAMGLDGQPRDFRQVFQIMRSYYLFSNLQKGKSPEDAEAKADTSAWNRTVRTFRGTDCKTPGICFTKDIAYREGNVQVWDIVKDKPDEMMRFNVGKYDPSNDRHLIILEQLGITDKDLQDLESE